MFSSFLPFAFDDDDDVSAAAICVAIWKNTKFSGIPLGTIQAAKREEILNEYFCVEEKSILHIHVHLNIDY